MIAPRSCPPNQVSNQTSAAIRRSMAGVANCERQMRETSPDGLTSHSERPRGHRPAVTEHPPLWHAHPGPVTFAQVIAMGITLRCQSINPSLGPPVVIGQGDNCEFCASGPGTLPIHARDFIVRRTKARGWVTFIHPFGRAGSRLTIRSPRIEAVAWSYEQVAASPASATSWPRPESGFEAHAQISTEAQPEVR